MKINHMSLFLFVVMALPVFAQMRQPSVMKMTPAMKSNLLARAGGLVAMPSKGPHVLVLNAQKKVSSEVARQVGAQISNVLQFSIVTKDGEELQDPMEQAGELLKDESNALLLLIIDTPKYPSLLVAPESRWVIVNIASLAAGNPTSDVLEKRLSKEIWRAFGMVLGGGNSTFSDCLMQPIFKVEQLDELQGKAISPDPLPRMLRTIEKLGIQPQRLTTYRKACEERWAPMPTNAIQRAIFEEVKAGIKKSPGSVTK